MDSMIYLAMTAAKHAELRQANTAHNLANVNTTAYKAVQESFRALPVVVRNERTDGALTRTYAVQNTIGYDARQGALKSTDNKHDFALVTDGFFAVQGPDGNEAYTRAGGFILDNSGTMRTKSGLLILSRDGGPLTVPLNAGVELGSDGTVFTVPLSGQDLTPQAVGQLKLVQPRVKDTYRGEDGLFRLNPEAASVAPGEGGPAAPGGANRPPTAPFEPNVRIATGVLESSNVDSVTSLVHMVQASRYFDFTMKLIQTADQNDRRSAQLLSLNG